MNRFTDRLEQDLRHIADRATPSSNAWEAIQDRISEQADQPELEITMLKPNPNADQPARAKILAAVAAAAVVVLGAIALLANRSNDTETIDTPPTTTEAPSTTASDSAEANLAVVLDFMEARAAYDGAAMRALVADDATIVLANEWIDTPDGYLVLDDFERASRMQFLELECTPGSAGRVRCTYSMESDLTRVLDVGPYPNSLVFDVTDGLITQVNHNRSTANSQAGDDGFVSVVYFQNFGPWLDENHPGDLARMFTAVSVDNVQPPEMTAESVLLWQQRVPEFVASLAGVADITIETTIMVDVVEGERVVGTGTGTFVVTNGASTLGCDAGTVEETYSFQITVDKVLTCTSGTRAGTLTLNAGGSLPNGTTAEWEITDATGDFAGLSGSGGYNGRRVVQDETGPNLIYVFETVGLYTDEIIGRIQLGDG